VGQERSAKGRRPTILRLNPQSRFVIGVELGAVACRAVLTDLHATPIRTESLPVRSAAPDDVLDAAMLGRAYHRQAEGVRGAAHATLSPDGTTVAYAMRVNGSWDIYSQRVGGRNATPIINDPQSDEGGPAFSPDGSLIAFHVSNALGGIFVAGATGESVRRLTNAGFDPAWSPDGTQIAFATEEVHDPSSRQGDSALYVVDAAGGALDSLADLPHCGGVVRIGDQERLVRLLQRLRDELDLRRSLDPDGRQGRPEIVVVIDGWSALQAELELPGQLALGEDLAGRIDLVLDGGNAGSIESTVLDLTASPPRLLRPGLIGIAELEALLGAIVRAAPASGES